MEIVFRDKDLDRLEVDQKFTAGFPREIVKAFRKRMQAIRSATDERDFYVLKSWHYEKLNGNRSHQRSIKLNDQWRLIIEIITMKPSNVIEIVAIEDYH